MSSFCGTDLAPLYCTAQGVEAAPVKPISKTAVSQPAFPPAIAKKELVKRLLSAKQASGKTFSQIAASLNYTNIYTAQLFYNQVWTIVRNGTPVVKDS